MAATAAITPKYNFRPTKNDTIGLVPIRAITPLRVLSAWIAEVEKFVFSDLHESATGSDRERPAELVAAEQPRPLALGIGRGSSWDAFSS